MRFGRKWMNSVGIVPWMSSRRSIQSQSTFSAVGESAAHRAGPAVHVPRPRDVQRHAGRGVADEERGAERDVHHRRDLPCFGLGAEIVSRGAAATRAGPLEKEETLPRCQHRGLRKGNSSRST